MCIGDALRDMPDEYREYVEEREREEEQSEAGKAIADGKMRWMRTEDGWRPACIRRRETYAGRETLVFSETPGAFCAFMAIEDDVKVLPYGEMPPSADHEGILEDYQEYLEPKKSEKPKAVASIVFKYDGGEWTHMANVIYIERHSYEEFDHSGDRTYRESPHFSFTLDDKYLGYVPQMEGEGRLTITMLGSGDVYTGKAHVHERNDFLDMNDPRTDRIVFKMKRDAEPEYEPIPLTPKPLLNSPCPRCPDCSIQVELRSMPDGIEQWCPVCNVKVDPDWKANADEEERHQKVVNWQSHDWARRPADMNKNWDEIDIVCMDCGVTSTPDNHDVQHCADKATEVEGPMHPDMIRAELQKSIDEEYRVDICAVAKYPQLSSRGRLIKRLTDGMAVMYTKDAGLCAFMTLDTIKYVKKSFQGELTR